MVLPTSTPEEIGNRIKQFRIEQKMTQAELAEKMNVSASAVSKWEKGINVPEVQTLYRLSDIFKIPISNLIENKIAEEGNTEDKKCLETQNEDSDSHKHKMLWKIVLGVIIVLIVFCGFLLYKEKSRFQTQIVDEFFDETSGERGYFTAYYLAVEYRGTITPEEMDTYMEKIREERYPYFKEAEVIFISFWKKYEGREHIEETDYFGILYP